MSELTAKEKIAKLAAMLFKDGELVNLGVGIPTLIPKFLPEGVDVWPGIGKRHHRRRPPAPPDAADPFFKDAGDNFCTILPGGCTFNSCTSFGLIRGGHLAYTVLGAMQVDEKGNLANWIVPGGKNGRMGGAMDLVSGAKKVVVASEHCSKDGSPKILEGMHLPPHRHRRGGLHHHRAGLHRSNRRGPCAARNRPGTTVEEVLSKTGATLAIADDLKRDARLTLCACTPVFRCFRMREFPSRHPPKRLPDGFPGKNPPSFAAGGRVFLSFLHQQLGDRA
jgi:3-oxoacid CoA-transferase B subunit